MRKTAASPAHSALRNLPAIERILSSDAVQPLLEAFGRERVKEAAVAHLSSLRSSRAPYDAANAFASMHASLTSAVSSTLRRVINGTGIIIHTNLGRSPVDAQLWARAGAIAASYSNLEFDIEEGGRGARDEHLAALCRSLFGAEGAVLANNNAAGTLLLLAAVAADREVIVSRGELVEIGGSFRVPDVIQQGGARLREVGTTNRTRARDYADAITGQTAAILRVHRSNFEIVGFTETPSIEELIEIARGKGIPMLYDEGSGRVVDLAPYGFASAPTLRELLASGVDVVTCSTDKLIGATQGGLILGRAEIIARVKKHPLMRALRAGKESYAVIAETLRAFATARHESEVPIYRMLAMPLEALRARAEELTRGTSAKIVETRCALGGGTTPTETIPSLGLELPAPLESDPPIIGRTQNDRFLIDVRTLLEEDLPTVALALRKM
ncbi:MAG TPA: L-seryl-tRNA(Sec) selenium transferase [Thermoanaerobaculia bacterium]|jgi:L-seryl-tRNA(Ser) seleniumtransferase|nr:L-seryl-tRNA(Sec) selenium transferase [Thermoanaerobaculia bacterium]